MKLYLAPLQGYTDAPFRHWFTEIYGTHASACFSPFLAIERGEPAARRLRDIDSPLNGNHALVPQIIFKDAEEFEILVSTLRARGHRRIDLNLGCPFPPQVKKGRGAGFLGRAGELRKVAEMIGSDADISYSVKMRLGVESPQEWRSVLPVLDELPLEHITVHPRTARQQYRGDLCLDSFEELAKETGKPLVFNGEIHTPGDIAAVSSRYPWLAGVMVGRGVLGRPSLLAEHAGGEEWEAARRFDSLMRFHACLLGHYREVLCGDTQLLARMKAFWEYPSGLPQRALKKIHKSHTIADYEAAVSSLRPSE